MSRPASVPPKEAGTASGILSTAQRIGTAVGIISLVPIVALPRRIPGHDSTS